MSEFSEISLVLGLVGTVTGIIALFIHFWRLRRENPRIKVKVLKCEHSFDITHHKIFFWAKFELRNLGDRGTSINDIDVSFKIDNEQHRLRKKYFRGTRPSEERQRLWINPHEIIDIAADYFEDYHNSFKETIDCTFIIYHTHSSEEVKAVSQKRHD